MTRLFFSDIKCFFSALLMVPGLIFVFGQTAAAQGRGGAVAVRGEIISFEGQTLKVKTPTGGTSEVMVPEGARVSTLARASFEDIKKGDFIASAGVRQKDGTLRAVELRIFPEQMRGRGEGHRPFRGGPDSTMTNATVDALVGSVDNRTLKVKYPDGEKTIVVPEDVPVMRQDVGDTSLLQPGARVSVTARREPDGRMTAVRIRVGKDGFVPPL